MRSFVKWKRTLKMAYNFFGRMGSFAVLVQSIYRTITYFLNGFDLFHHILHKKWKTNIAGNLLKIQNRKVKHDYNKKIKHIP